MIGYVFCTYRTLRDPEVVYSFFDYYCLAFFFFFFCLPLQFMQVWDLLRLLVSQYLFVMNEREIEVQNQVSVCDAIPALLFIRCDLTFCFYFFLLLVCVKRLQGASWIYIYFYLVICYKWFWVKIWAELCGCIIISCHQKRTSTTLLKEFTKKLLPLSRIDYLSNKKQIIRKPTTLL